MLTNFNLIGSTTRGNERQMCYELNFLLREAGDPQPLSDRTGIRGLVVGKTNLNPIEAIEKFHEILQAHPYEFRYALRIIPIQKVVHTNLAEIKQAAAEFSVNLAENETFRVTVEKRFTELHSRELIEATATAIPNNVNLKNPDKILLIEILGDYTGISLLRPTNIISVLKEKML